jgi:adenylate cyclase
MLTLKAWWPAQLHQGDKKMKKILLSPWLALVTLALIVGVRFADPSFVESVRLRYFDQLVIAQPATDIPVHTVNIDEDALDKYGQFPFPRTTYASIIEDLYKRNAGLVVFNILMPETDRFGGDAQLAKVLERYPTILPEVAATKGKNKTFGTAVQVVGADPSGALVEYPGIIANVPVLEERAAGVGVVNTFPEIDGVVRRMPLLIMSDNTIHPSLALETLRVGVGDTKIQVKITDMGVEALRVPKLSKITVDPLSRVWIDWAQTPKEHSLANLPTDFNKEIVIVGLSAAGLVNPVSTAKGEVWPQYLQASLLGTMLNGKTIQRPGYADDLEILAILVAGVVLLLLTRWMYVGIGTMVGLAVVSIYGSMWAYANYSILFDITAFVFGVVLVGLHAYVVKFLDEFFQKSQIKKQFGSYVNPVIVERLQKDPSFIKLGGEKKDLTIIMSDMRNFTGLGETYGDDVVAFTQTMNRYMTAIAEPILRNNGCLIKFIGDASLHVHGAPIQEEQDPDHAHAAVRTGLEMIHAVELFNIELEKEGKPRVGMGLGINTGPTLIGNIGSKDRFGYDVLGDSVSLTARLESQTKNYGQLIIISEFTEKRVNDQYFTIPLDCIAVKGKTVGVSIFTVFYMPDETVKVKWNTARDMHNGMLTYYKQQKWDDAIELCKTLTGEFDGNMDHYYELWIERIADMRSRNLPADWDGTYRATSK